VAATGEATARAALREPAAEMRVVETDLVAQHLEQRCIRRHLDGLARSFSSKAMRSAISNPFALSGCSNQNGEV
jgi:hypothetical protein